MAYRTRHVGVAQQTPGGTQVLGFGVAVNDRRRNQQTGEWEDYPNFIDCTMFGNRAEALSRILRKGMKVAILDTGIVVDHPNFGALSEDKLTESSLTKEGVDAIWNTLNAGRENVGAT